MSESNRKDITIQDFTLIVAPDDAAAAGEERIHQLLVTEGAEQGRMIELTAASITAGKRRRIVLAAQHYLLGKPDCDCRFDCVLIDSEQLAWLKNAFAADD